MPPAQPAGQEARLGRPIPKSSIAALSAVSLPPKIQHSASHAENAGPIYFSNRLRIADVRPSIHFIADDFLSLHLARLRMLPPHVRPTAGESTPKKTGVQLFERDRSLRTGKCLYHSREPTSSQRIVPDSGYSFGRGGPHDSTNRPPL